MNSKWYYVLDGKPCAPVSEAELKELVRSGQLCPHDLVWREGMPHWVPASSVEGLAPAPKGPPPPPVGALLSAPGKVTEGAIMSSEWYYAQERKQCRPVSEAQLKELAGSGQLRPHDLVWRKGFPQWAPASSVEGLFPAPKGPPPLPPATGIVPQQVFGVESPPKGPPPLPRTNAPIGLGPTHQPAWVRSGEQVVYRARTHSGVFVGPIMLTAIVFLFCLLVHTYNPDPRCWLLMIFPGIDWLGAIYRYNSGELVVTNKRVIRMGSRGDWLHLLAWLTWFDCRYGEMSLESVTNIHVKLPLTVKLLGHESYGTLFIAGPRPRIITFFHITAPFECRRVIQRMLVAYAVNEGRGLIPALIAGMDHPDAVAHPEAIVGNLQRLESLTGQDFGPAAKATAADRTRAVAAWKAWWEEQMEKRTS